MYVQLAKNVWIHSHLRKTVLSSSYGIFPANEKGNAGVFLNVL